MNHANERTQTQEADTLSQLAGLFTVCFSFNLQTCKNYCTVSFIRASSACEHSPQLTISTVILQTWSRHQIIGKFWDKAKNKPTLSYYLASQQFDSIMLHVETNYNSWSVSFLQELRLFQTAYHPWKKWGNSLTQEQRIFHFGIEFGSWIIRRLKQG